MQSAKAAHGAFLARRKLAAFGSSRAPCAFSQPAVLSALLVTVVWDCDPTSIFPLKSTKRSAAAILGRNAPSLLFMVRFGIFCCRQDFLLCFT